MSEWDDPLEDGEEFVIEVGDNVYVACCDCGLVHRILTARNETGEIGLVFYRDERRTAQLRRYGFGDLQKEKNKNWKLLRRGM